MSTKLSPNIPLHPDSFISEETIYTLVENGYAAYQTFVNDGKFIPSIDGLKFVHRRYMLAVRDIAKSRFQKSAMVLGNAMGKWHPHEFQKDVLYSLVRWGFVTGQGNFGMTSSYTKLASADIRYTEVKYSSKLDNLLFRFEDYFNYIEGESGFDEPEFLITPIPIALLRGCIGIGVGGVRTKIPAFTYESLLDAYANDNPNLLKSSYGLEIDYEKSTLKSLWTIGHGKVVLKFKTIRSMDGNSIEISGDCTQCRPDLSKILRWESQGLLDIIDLTDNKMKLSISRVKGIRKISDKDIFDEVRRVSLIDDMRATHIIMFSHKGKAIKMGIKGWLDLTLGLYKSTYTKWKSMEINKRKNLIDKYTLIPTVAKLIQEGKTTVQISKEVEKTEKFVSSIESLPMKLLRKSDFNSVISKISKEIESIESAKVDELVSSGSVIDSLVGFY